MKDYRQMAFRYLWKNKERSISTILGVALCSALLFVILNTAFSYYEVVFLEQARKNSQEPEFQTVALVFLVLVLLVTYSFAILGVGVVRNTINLILLEQSRDFGMLRCIGASRVQVKEYISCMTFFLEGTGMFLGVCLGAVGSGYAARAVEIPWKFYWSAALLVIAAFIFDLFFMIREHCRFLFRSSPAEAVMGNQPGEKEKIKKRRNGISGLFFGVYGAYAWKSLCRKPGRFWKNVFSFSFGIMGIFLAIFITTTFKEMNLRLEKEFGWYQIGVLYSIEGPSMYGGTESVEVASPIPKTDREKMLSLKRVTGGKNAYRATVFASDCMKLRKAYTEEMIAIMGTGNYVKNEENTEQTKEVTIQQGVADYFYSHINVYGYDEEDIKRLKKSLVEGTLQVSENGVILINQKSDFVSGSEDYRSIKVSNYKLGDEIEIVDNKALKMWIDTRYNRLTPKERLELAGGEESKEKLIKWILYLQGKEELKKKGYVKTYRVEGIVNRDVNIYDYSLINSIGLELIVPLDNYRKLTGADLDNPNGYFFHIEGTKTDVEFRNVWSGIRCMYDPMDELVEGYLDFLESKQMIFRIFFILVVGVLFIFSMNLLNMLNTTASNLFLRRKELAQLVILGMNKRQLLFTVLLEGILIVLTAGIIGGLGSYTIFLVVKKFVSTYGFEGWSVNIQFPWLFFLLILLGCATIICGCMALSIMKMRKYQTEFLTVSGE